MKTNKNGQPGRTIASLLASSLVVVSAISGCGDDKPELSDSRNYLVEAREAMNAGDNAKAMEMLKSSIEAQPNTWAYIELAKLQVEAGEDEAAMQNIEAGLALDPDSADMKWLKGELEKPEGKRFQGRFKNPPSASK